MRVGIPGLLVASWIVLVACAAPGPDAERVAALEERNAELERSLTEARERAQRLRGRHKAGMQITQCHWDPPVDTSVRGVEGGFVVLAAGLADGVEVGFTFDVYRGSIFKGQARVVEVFDSGSRAMILNQRVAIEVGDLASTTL